MLDQGVIVSFSSYPSNQKYTNYVFFFSLSLFYSEINILLFKSVTCLTLVYFLFPGGVVVNAQCWLTKT